MSGMTIPTIPVLPAGYVVQLADMQNLSACATFLLGKPISRVMDETGGAAIGTSFAPISFTNTAFDPDGMFSLSQPTRLTIQTPGWYKLRYMVNCGTVGGTYVANVVGTTGSNNPAGSGLTVGPYWQSGGVNTTSDRGRPAGSGIWPVYLYAGDYLQVQVEAAATGSQTGVGAGGITTTLAGSMFSLEYVSI